MPDTSCYRGPTGVTFAHEAIEELAAQCLPTTPANYEIWASYKARANLELCREIDARLSAGLEFTDDIISELFDRFFGSTRLSVQIAEASECIARELSEAVSTMRDVGEHSGQLTSTFDAAAARFDGGMDPSVLRSLVSELAATTRDMARRNRDLSLQMKESARRVEGLQITLENVRIEALTDGLTGLANRRHFDEVLRRRIQEASTSKEPLTLVMCDIDHFKRFNDQWGHQVGDQVIRFIAQALRQHCVGDALAARYGGEEFAVIMPRRTLKEAAQIGELILHAVRARKLTRRSTGETIGSVTISLGLAQFTDPESASDLIARADACLYTSKRNGRDRMTLDDQSERAATTKSMLAR